MTIPSFHASVFDLFVKAAKWSHDSSSGQDESAVKIHHGHEFLETFERNWLFGLSDSVDFARQRRGTMLCDAVA